MQTDFTTERLTISRLTMHDFDAYCQLISLPEVGTGAGFNLIGNQKMLGEVAKRQIQAPGSLGVYHESQLVGAVLFFPAIGENHLPDENHLELSYFLAPQYWNQGFMTEALAKVLTQLPDRITVSAEVFSDNRASMALLRKLGFESVGQLYDPIAGRDKLLYTAKRA
ncbi:GNAT family N-acetyltransferase [Lentilactobacillus kisonensis]|uniref:Toxin-antitoxin system, toxin component, GNAT domain protein n=1 Tax=Lentilactobacillus kisonensis DSM 19906 = JCM 15041 TaxID=1423766 RepID=A0A0R1P046_9LACO|nr:GNAT family N-acetyltransferase [Lentilactobacillus kisonensis]KRL22299.1 toxin-antitoxin system, toxin component, GNAT domain protein [Lentilactobacillus kisonensis DSM 19906 = JCM 15041]